MEGEGAASGPLPAPPRWPILSEVESSSSSSSSVATKTKRRRAASGAEAPRSIRSFFGAVAAPSSTATTDSVVESFLDRRIDSVVDSATFSVLSSDSISTEVAMIDDEDLLEPIHVPEEDEEEAEEKKKRRREEEEEVDVVGLLESDDGGAVERVPGRDGTGILQNWSGADGGGADDSLLVAESAASDSGRESPPSVVVVESPAAMARALSVGAADSPAALFFLNRKQRAAVAMDRTREELRSRAERSDVFDRSAGSGRVPHPFLLRCRTVAVSQPAAATAALNCAVQPPPVVFAHRPASFGCEEMPFPLPEWNAGPVSDRGGDNGSYGVAPAADAALLPKAFDALPVIEVLETGLLCGFGDADFERRAAPPAEYPVLSCGALLQAVVAIEAACARSGDDGGLLPPLLAGMLRPDMFAPVVQLLPELASHRAADTAHSRSDVPLPWPEVLSPPSLGAFLGRKTAVDRATRWLTRFEDAFSERKSMPSRRRLRKGLVLCGPCGSGKTSFAHSLASGTGYDVLECNSSMARSARDMVERYGEAAVSGVVGRRPPLFLIDDADVVLDDDNGFYAALLDLLATSRYPVVLTASALSAELRAVFDAVPVEIVEMTPLSDDDCRALVFHVSLPWTLHAWQSVDFPAFDAAMWSRWIDDVIFCAAGDVRAALLRAQVDCISMSFARPAVAAVSTTEPTGAATEPEIEPEIVGDVVFKLGCAERSCTALELVRRLAAVPSAAVLASSLGAAAGDGGDGDAAAMARPSVRLRNCALIGAAVRSRLAVVDACATVRAICAAQIQMQSASRRRTFSFHFAPELVPAQIAALASSPPIADEAAAHFLVE